MKTLSNISREELQDLSIINDTSEIKAPSSLSTLNDPDRKDIELKNDPITNAEIRNALNIKKTKNERDTVSEDAVIASESDI